jgi:2-C-methyl-D-erythritol 4-phosphate cytidylyltransferase
MNPGTAPLGVTAVIAAAGSGERLGAGGPKAFVPLAGRPMVEWSLDAFRAAGVAAIVVACPPEVASGATPAELSSSRLPDAEQVGPGDDTTLMVAGGATRAESVSNALEEVATEVVAIHDAARPLLTPALVDGVVRALAGDPSAAGAIAATPLTDTVKQIAGRVVVSGVHRPPERPLEVGTTLDRGRLWAAQTPQVFRVAALREALAAHPDPGAATDEAMLVEAAGGRVLIYPAPAENIKVTTPLDLRLAELLLAERAAG